MILATCIPHDTHMVKYSMGGIPAGGVYLDPIHSIWPFLSALSILQDRDLAYRSAE